MKTFITFKPKDPTVAKYVDYYYLDSKPDNKLTEFRCFPHYNNTISLYRSHQRLSDRTMVYDPQADPMQIFTPIRDRILDVRQRGAVHRIVLVFRVLGIQQFYRSLDFSDYLLDVNFFSREELASLFDTLDPEQLQPLLDRFLLHRYLEFNYPVLERAAQFIFDQTAPCSVEKMAREIGISRRHLNRIFKQHLGVSVKMFQTIVWFRKTMERKLFIDPEENFTQLAYALHFSDQPHLNKTFEKLTQNAPRQFFKKGTLLGREDTFWHIG